MYVFQKAELQIMFRQNYALQKPFSTYSVYAIYSVAFLRTRRKGRSVRAIASSQNKKSSRKCRAKTQTIACFPSQWLPTVTMALKK